jgi:hypothetical protein
MRKICISILLVFAMTGIITGCGQQKEVVKPIEIVSTANSSDTTDATDPATEETAVEVSHEGMYQSELTNEWIDDSIQNQRPIAVMVDNESIALPHYGLTQADVVYEMTNSTMNAGITRFMVIVKDWESIKQLGSIRSVRSTNLMIAPEWNAIVCHDGGPFYINEYLQNAYVQHFSGTFSRVDNGKSREYTEYILSGDLDKNFEDSGYSTDYNKYYAGKHFQFASEESPVDLSSNDDAIESTQVNLPFKHNKPYLEYNKEDGFYYYSEYGSPNVDPGNGNLQLSFKNVILQNTEYEVYDEEGYMVFDVKASGRSGYYITNGVAIPITWEKDKDVNPTKYYNAAGDEITLNTGKTYIAIIPNDLWDDLVIE